MGQNLSSAIFSVQEGQLRLTHPSRLMRVVNSKILESYG